MTQIRTRTSITLLAALLAVGTPLLTSCGQIADKAAEGIAEKAAGDAIGGDVDINGDGVTVTDASGNAVAMGEDVALPDNWPAEIPVLDGGKLAMVSVEADGAATAMWTTDATAQEAAAAYGEVLTSAGFEAPSAPPSSMGGVYLAEYTGNGFTVTVQALEADGSTTVLIAASKDS